MAATFAGEPFIRGPPALPIEQLARAPAAFIVSSVIPEDLDLQKLTAELRQALGAAEPQGYLRGKALMRDALVQAQGYSQLEAEELIDTLESRGFIHFLGDPAERSQANSGWEIQARASP